MPEESRAKSRGRWNSALRESEIVKFIRQGTGEEIDFVAKKVLVVGYTGRDQAAVRTHIEELAAQGIPAPKEIPTVFRTPLDRLLVNEDLEVVGQHTSGEAEAVLLVDGRAIWVAVGSDHTDRELEKVDILASKQVCPKPLSIEVWNYGDLRDRWDSLVLRSWVGEAGREQLYQEGRMSDLLPPDELLEMLHRRLGGSLEGSVIYTGTIPLRGKVFWAKPYFEAELVDPLTGRSIRCRYRVRRVDDV
jgi:hypothetical protein